VLTPYSSRGRFRPIADCPARLRQLLTNGSVTLQQIDRDEDRYGRKLRIVLVGGISVGDTLAGEGLSRWYGGGRQPWC